jgi:hypothetical protein
MAFTLKTIHHEDTKVHEGTEGYSPSFEACTGFV